MKKSVMLLLFCVTGFPALAAAYGPRAATEEIGLPTGVLMAAAQAQAPSIVEQNRVVPPKDALNGADWLKAQGVSQGLGELDLGVDAKGKPIKFMVTGGGGAVELKLTGSGLDKALAGDKAGGGIMGKIRKKDDPAHGASGLTVTDLFGPHFAPSNPKTRMSNDAESANSTLGKLVKLNVLAGGGTDHYLEGSNLYPSDLRIIELNAPIIKLLAEGKPDEANKLYSSLHAPDAGADLGTSDPAKMALIQNLNTAMENLTAQEQAGAKTLHFKAEAGEIVTHLDEQQTTNIDQVLKSMSPDKLFETGRLTYKKDATGKGVVAVDSSISSQDVATAAAPLKIAVDTGDANKVKAYQKYKGISDLNLPKR